MKLMSIAFGALTLIASVKLVRAAGLRRWARLLALGAIGGSWALAVSSTNGLETSLVAFLTTLLAALLIGGEHVTRSAVTGVVAGALAITRPESMLIVLLLALAVAARPGEHGYRRSLRWVVGPLLAVVVLVVARLAYFGSVVPNTYHAKKTGAVEGLVTASRYVRKSQPVWDALDRPGAAVALVVQFALVCAAAVLVHRHRRALLPLAAVVAGQAVFVLTSGGDWMRGARFLAPLLPALAVLLVIGLVAVVGRCPPGRGRTATGAALGAAVLAVTCWPVTSAFSPVWRTASFDDRSLVEVGNSDFDGASSRLWAMGPDLVACLGPGSSVAYTEMGYFGFARQDLHVIDMRGLTDAEIARTAPDETRTFYGIVDHEWFDADSATGRILTERRPEMILSFDAEPRSTVLGGDYLLDRVIVWGPLTPLGVYVRKDFSCG
jgi:hypothetical protein